MKNKIITISFVVIIEFFFLLSIIVKDEDISRTERRHLKQFPEFTFAQFIDGNFVDEFEEYSLDQFPFRDSFRSLKANFNYHVFNQLDNNDIYLNEDGIFKIEYPTDTKSIDEFVIKINNIISHLNENNHVYAMIVPDKNYYVDDKVFLKLDYDLLYAKMDELNSENIDIRDLMNIDDYYQTDPHWRQEKLDKVVKRMSEVMDFPYIKIDYQQNIYPDFYGAYYGQAALKRNPESLVYLTHDIFDQSVVTYLENPQLHQVYNVDKLQTMDAYEVFLDGASSFITIQNENSNTDKELVVFRDSFGSSFVPLLIPYYSRITVIDIRYITSDYYLDKVDFINQDVLFLYSTLLVNNSYSLKK